MLSCSYVKKGKNTEYVNKYSAWCYHTDKLSLSKVVLKTLLASPLKGQYSNSHIKKNLCNNVE